MSLNYLEIIIEQGMGGALIKGAPPIEHQGFASHWTPRAHLSPWIRARLARHKGVTSLDLKGSHRSLSKGSLRLSREDRHRLKSSNTAGGPHHFKGLMARPKGHIISSMLLRWGHLT